MEADGLLGDSYKLTHPKKSDYDVIVVGGGIGGLVCASLLTKFNRRVIVLEQHSVVGGFAHVFKRKGFEFTSGFSYMAGVRKSGYPSRDLFDYITEKRLKWAAHPTIYEHAYFIEDKYNFGYPADESEFKIRLIADFPGEREAIDKYLSIIKKIYKSFSYKTASKVLPWSIGNKLFPRSHQFYSEMASKTTWEVLTSLTTNKKLIAVLTAQWGQYGLPPKQSSFIIHALLQAFFMKGADYPIGGSDSISKEIVYSIKKWGGEVLHSAEVSKIIIENGEARGVRLKDGREIKGRSVVSAVGLDTTFNSLMDNNDIPNTYKNELEKLKPAMSFVFAFLGLEGSLDDFKYKNSGCWVHDGYDFDGALERSRVNVNCDIPLVWLSNHSGTDPIYKQTNPNKFMIDLIAPTNVDFFEKWTGTRWGRRDTEYKDFKSIIGERLIKKAETIFPTLRNHIAYSEVATPLTIKHFSNRKMGNAYGLSHDKERFNSRILKPKTPIKNLYLTGSDIVSLGVTSSAISGALTSIEVMGLYDPHCLLVLNLISPHKF